MLENNYLKMAYNMKPFCRQWKRYTWVQVKFERQRSGDSEYAVRSWQGKGTGQEQFNVLGGPSTTAASTSQTFINPMFNSVSDPLNTNLQNYEPHQHHSPLGLILHLYLCSTSYEPLQAGQLYLYSSWYQTMQDPLPQCSSELLLRFQYCFLMIKILELHS